MGTIIDDKKLKEIFEDIMKIYQRHGLTKEEIFYASQKFHVDFKVAFMKEKQKETASNLISDMLNKFGFGGVGK